jgi:hypothetical protein
MSSSAAESSAAGTLHEEREQAMNPPAAKSSPTGVPVEPPPAGGPPESRSDIAKTLDLEQLQAKRSPDHWRNSSDVSGIQKCSQRLVMRLAARSSCSLTLSPGTRSSFSPSTFSQVVSFFWSSSETPKTKRLRHCSCPF